MMTKQEIFDKVVAHLRAQNRKAIDEQSLCCYRGPDRTKCAAGCLILDEHYSRDLEGMTVGQSLVRSALRASGVPKEADDLVQALQSAHDSYLVSQWEGCFSNIAAAHGLTYAAP